MASGSATAGSQSSVGESEGRLGPGVVDPRYPLWAYVQKLVPEEANGDGAAVASGSRGGNAKFRCNFCKKIYLGSYSRVKPHLLQITKKDIATCDKIPHSAFEQSRSLHLGAKWHCKLGEQNKSLYSFDVFILSSGYFFYFSNLLCCLMCYTRCNLQ